MSILPLHVPAGRRLDELIGMFRTWLQGEIRAGRNKPKTEEYYVRELRHWESTLDPGILVDDLIAFHLTGGGGARRHCVQAAQRLLNWAVEMGLVKVNPFGNIKLPRAGERKRTLQRDQMAKLFRACNRGARWVLVFMRRTLARPGEIRRLRWRDYREQEASADGRTPAVRQFVLTEFKAKERRGDRAKTRVFPVDAVLARILANWRRQRNPQPDDMIFTSRRGKPWSKDSLRLAVRAARTRAGLGKVDGEAVVAYTLRHTGATTATRNGVQQRLLADLMGHAQIATTERYQHDEGEHLGPVVDQALKVYRAPKPRPPKAGREDQPGLFDGMEEAG